MCPHFDALLGPYPWTGHQIAEVFTAGVDDLLSPSKTKATVIDRMSGCGLEHHQTHQVVNDLVHEQFLFDHLRRFCPQHIHAQCGFDIAKTHFNRKRPPGVPL